MVHKKPGYVSACVVAVREEVLHTGGDSGVDRLKA